MRIDGVERYKGYLKILVEQKLCCIVFLTALKLLFQVACRLVFGYTCRLRNQASDQSGQAVDIVTRLCPSATLRCRKLLLKEHSYDHPLPGGFAPSNRA